MDAAAFLHVAGRWCAGRDPDEPTLRSCVSRAYYGAFHCAREFLVELTHDPRRSHGATSKFLMNSGHGAAWEAGKLLADLQGERVKADYELASTRFLSKAQVQRKLELAHEVLSALARCNDDESRELIRSSISEYRNKTNQ